MAKIDIKNFNDEGVRIDVDEMPGDENAIQVVIDGYIDIPHASEILLPYFLEIHNKVVESKMKLVEVDLTRLSFMNSSAIGSMVQWFSKIPRLSDDEKYKMKILYTKNEVWQLMGLKALKKLLSDQLELVEM